MSKATRIALIAIVVLLMIPFAIDWLIETDAEAIERLTVEMKSEFLDGNVDAVRAFLLPAATMGGDLGKRRLADAVPGYADRVRQEVERISLSLREIVVEGEEASGTWTVNVRLKPGSTTPFFRFKVRIDYRRQDQGSTGLIWRVRHVEVDAS